MASLRARLFAGLALLAVATGLAAGGLAFRWAFQEAIELQDAKAAWTPKPESSSKS
jgi:two-component system, OmpR family, sensor kinase